MLLYDNETNENKYRTKDKIELQHIHYLSLNEISSLSLLRSSTIESSLWKEIIYN